MSLKSLLSKPHRGNTFNHKPTSIGYEDLICETKISGRKYITPEGTAYPSITTVLGSLSKDGIEAWKKRVGEEEANRIGHHACTRGTAMHEAIERYLNNEEHWFVENEMPNVKSLFNALRPILDKRVDNILLQEGALYSDHLKLAGRVDCIAEFDGKLSIIDFKTATRPKNKEYITSYFMKASAYAIMFEERTGIPITQTVILMAVDNSPTPIIFKETRDNYTKQLIETIQNYYETNK
jgi:CRISPR/Cas system-associated exonuclease Cas4 (RecB family)